MDPAWFQHLKLTHDAMLSSFGFNYCNLCPYTQDALIRNVNRVEGDRLNVFYSTPATYLDAKKGNPNMTWPLKTGRGGLNLSTLQLTFSPSTHQLNLSTL